MTQQTHPRVRRESLQRVQVGLIGLGAVLLVVAFANIVIRNVHTDTNQLVTGADGTQTAIVAGTSNGAAPLLPRVETEPLADLGVTPKSEQAAAPPITVNPVAPSVPDLEPDPRLSKPMDQDPKKPAQASPAP